jgi:hypothetical protein
MPTTEEKIIIVPGPNSDFGKYIREKKADRLFRELKKLSPDTRIDTSSKEYKTFWANYSSTPEFREEIEKFYGLKRQRIC